MRKFKITGTRLCRTIRQIDPDFKVSEPQISRHRNGQAVHSSLVERILEALSFISPESKTFYLVQLGNDAGNAAIATNLAKPSTDEVIEWAKTAENQEIAKVMYAIALRLEEAKTSDDRTNADCPQG